MEEKYSHEELKETIILLNKIIDGYKALTESHKDYLKDHNRKLREDNSDLFKKIKKIEVENKELNEKLRVSENQRNLALALLEVIRPTDENQHNCQDVGCFLFHPGKD